MSIQKWGEAHWQGSIKEGQGTLTTESGVLKDQPYSFKSRIENATGTNPEELLAAAHSGCFSMALSGILTEAGYTIQSIDTKANLVLEKNAQGFVISAVHLQCQAKIDNLDEENFQKMAKQAKENCPVSKLFNTAIDLKAELLR